MLTLQNLIFFYFIFDMDWLDACFASIDCRIRVVIFNFLKENILELKGGNSIPRGLIISRYKSCMMISKGFLYLIVRFQDLDN